MTTTKKNPDAPKKVGILVGWETTFPEAFIKAVNEKGQGKVVAEMARFHAPIMGEHVPYDVLVDRISHEIEVYKPYLKNAVLSGTYVINDPFWWLADDKFFDNAMVEKLGVAVPRTVVLPPVTPKSSTRPESHRNMCLTDWNKVFDYIKFPAILKDYKGGGWKHVYKVNSPEEFFKHYHETGEIVMVLQECIEFEHYVRCLCIGKDNILPIKYDVVARDYIIDDAHMSPELGAKVVRDARTICHALGYDMNSVEFAIRDGVPYAIDFMNPAPDMDFWSLHEPYFNWVVNAMSDFVIEVALDPKRKMAQHYPWMKMINGEMPVPQVEAPKAKAAKAPAAKAEKELVAAAPAKKAAAPAKKK